MGQSGILSFTYSGLHLYTKKALKLSLIANRIRELGMNTDSQAIPHKANCPVNGQSYARVDIKTILHQIKHPWKIELPDQGYYFCDDPSCDVVYFGEDRRTLIRNDIRIEVGQKSRYEDKSICYCFDVHLSDLETDNALQEIKSFVTKQTRNGGCDCVIRNPSGKCCLKDFPRK